MQDFNKVLDNLGNIQERLVKEQNIDVQVLLPQNVLDFIRKSDFPLDVLFGDEFYDLILDGVLDLFEKRAEKRRRLLLVLPQIASYKTRDGVSVEIGFSSLKPYNEMHADFKGFRVTFLFFEWPPSIF